jgi:hypothetical protein
MDINWSGYGYEEYGYGRMAMDWAWIWNRNAVGMEIIYGMDMGMIRIWDGSDGLDMGMNMD